jgi:hypothetical protein
LGRGGSSRGIDHHHIALINDDDGVAVHDIPAGLGAERSVNTWRDLDQLEAGCRGLSVPLIPRAGERCSDARHGDQ